MNLRTVTVVSITAKKTDVKNCWKFIQFQFNLLALLLRVDLDFTSLTSFHPEFLQVLFIIYLKRTIYWEEIAFTVGGGLASFW